MGLVALVHPIICPFLCIILAKFVSQFSQELCQLEPSNRVYASRMNDCFVGKKVRLIALLFFYYPFFFLSLFCMFTSKICVRVFSGSIGTRLLEFTMYMDDELWYCVIVSE